MLVMGQVDVAKRREARRWLEHAAYFGTIMFTRKWVEDHIIQAREQRTDDRRRTDGQTDGRTDTGAWPMVQPPPPPKKKKTPKLPF